MCFDIDILGKCMILVNVLQQVTNDLQVKHSFILIKVAVIIFKIFVSQEDVSM